MDRNADGAGPAPMPLWCTQGGSLPETGTLNLQAFYREYEAQRNQSRGTLGTHAPQVRLAQQAAPAETAPSETVEQGEIEAYTSSESISDPLEPLNRAFFHFNDKLYFWFLKPVAKGYRTVVPQTARLCVRNFFYNLAGPIRMVNCILQGKVDEASYEFSRLFVNTLIGLGGLVDVASEGMDLDRYDEDLGQTLGTYGMGPSIFINWPFLGPSCVRDTVGFVGDAFLNPVNYLVPQTKYNVAVKTGDRINETSLSIGDYEDLKRSALDPYVSMRDAYYQYRKKEIAK
ncbi:MAG: VacJ family lipoprotein [Desulfobacteraceae bacterium]